MTRGSRLLALWTLALFAGCGGAQLAETPPRPQEPAPSPSDVTAAVPVERAQSTHGPHTTPNVIWRAQTQGPIVASPVEAPPNGGIVIGSLDGALYRFSHLGALVFRVDTGAPIRARALVVGHGMDSHVIVTNERGDVVRVDGAGNVVWRARLGSPIVVDPIQASNGHILVAADGIYALDEHGNVHWHHVEATTIYGAPLRFPPGIVYGTVDGRVVGLSEQGAERWTTRVNAAVTDSLRPRHDGTLSIHAAGKQYVLSSDGVLVSMTELAAEPNATVDSEGNRYLVTSDQMLIATWGDGTPLWRYSLGANVAGSVLLTSTGTLVVGADDGILYTLH